MAWNSLKSLLDDELPRSRSAASLKLSVLLLPAHTRHVPACHKTCSEAGLCLLHCHEDTTNTWSMPHTTTPAARASHDSLSHLVQHCAES